jgi:hypothetical protein
MNLVSVCMSSLVRQSTAIPLLLTFLVEMEMPIFEGEMFFWIWVSVLKWERGGKSEGMFIRLDELELAVVLGRGRG